jgi:hypothetical protein
MAEGALDRVVPTILHRNRSKRLLERPASGCGPRAAAIAAITFARSPNASKWHARTSHQEVEKRTAAHTRPGLKHKNGGFCLAQCFVPKWRATVDENGQYCFAVAL